MEAHMQTNQGTIKLKLFYEHAPITVANFINLAKRIWKKKTIIIIKIQTTQVSI